MRPGRSDAPMPGAPYTVDSDLRQPSGATPLQLDLVLAGTPLGGLGASFATAEAKYAVNSVYLAAHAILESDWGRSKLAQSRNNLFGFQAYDNDPEAGRKFSSFAEGIDYVAGYISRQYLTSTGRWYGGAASLRGMNAHYASDPGWCKKITAIMNQLAAAVRRQQTAKGLM